MTTLWQDIRYGVAILWLMLGVVGCGIPEVRTTPELAALASKTREIESVQLTEQSKSPPVSIEEATKDAAKAATEPNQARPVMKLTLEEVRAAALANNLDLKVQLVSPSIAQQTVDIERARFESVFFGSGHYTHSELEDGDTTSTGQYEAGVTTPLQTGGSVTVSLPYAQVGGLSEAAASVSVVQSLLRGAGTRVSTSSIQIAGYQKGGVDAFTKLQAIIILGNADIAYWQLYAARKGLTIGREQYKLAQDQLRHAHAKVAAGSAAKNEIVYAEAGLSQRLDVVISAETAVRDAQRTLKRMMNRPDMPLSSPIEIDPATEPDPKGLDLDQQALVEAALANRMELAELEFRLAIGEIDVALARNGLLPLLDLEYTYGAGGQAGDAGGAFESLFRNAAQDHRIGLSATIPLGNLRAEARLRQARLTQIQDQVGRERLEQHIRQEVDDELDNLQQNWRRILAANQGVVTATRNYQVRQLQFQLGRPGTDSTEVLRAAETLAEAQLRRIGAFANYEIAQVRLARATGTLLGHGRVQLQPVVLEAGS